MNNLEEMIFLINIINTDPTLSLYLSMTKLVYINSEFTTMQIFVAAFQI